MQEQEIPENPEETSLPALQPRDLLVFIHANGLWNEDTVSIPVEWIEDFANSSDPTKLLLAAAKAQRDAGSRKFVCAVKSGTGEIFLRSTDLGLLACAAARAAGTAPESILEEIRKTRE